MTEERRSWSVRIQEWLGGFLAISVFYFAVYVAISIMFPRGPHARWWIGEHLDYWRECGGAWQLLALAIGYLLLLLATHGKLSMRLFWKSKAWLVLVPFVLAGSCFGRAYVQSFQEPHYEKRVTIIGKRKGTHETARPVPGGDVETQSLAYYELIVDEPKLTEWKLPSGRWVEGAAIFVTERQFESHSVGQRVLVRDHCTGLELTESVEAGAKTDWQFAALWVLIGCAGFWWSRRDL